MSWVICCWYWGVSKMFIEDCSWSCQNLPNLANLCALKLLNHTDFYTTLVQSWLAPILAGERYRILELSRGTKTLRGLSKSYLLLSNLPLPKSRIEALIFFFLGYAFITMDDERDAKAAIDELNGTTIDGQEVKVELSKPRSGGKIRFSWFKCTD